METCWRCFGLFIARERERETRGVGENYLSIDGSCYGLCSNSWTCTQFVVAGGLFDCDSYPFGGCLGGMPFLGHPVVGFETTYTMSQITQRISTSESTAMRL